MGGPIGRKLILKHDLLKTVIPEDDSILVEDEQKHHRSVACMHLQLISLR